MLVDVTERVANVCAQVLPGMLVLKVGHPKAACERMLVTRPLVIVFASKHADEVAMLTEDRKSTRLNSSH